MTHPHSRALEAAARLIHDKTRRFGENTCWDNVRVLSDQRVLSDLGRDLYRNIARAAVTAYLAEAGDGRLSELERENARMRELLSETMMDIAIFEDIGHIRARAMERRAALAGSGEP